MMFTPLNEFNPIAQPQTVDDVVDLLFRDISLRDRVVMSKLSENDIDASVYLAMAKIVRKEFKLNDGNNELLSSCSSYLGKGYDAYEDPAMVIMKELWKKVKDNTKLRLVTAN